LKSNNLSSGKHVSRLSVRTISDGYQKHEVNGNHYLLDKNQYLVINDGETFSSEINTNKPIEALLIAFNKNQINDLSYNFSSTHERLLDNPFGMNGQQVEFKTDTYTLNWELQSLFGQLKRNIVNQHKENIIYQELFNQILGQLLSSQYDLSRKLSKLKIKKKSTLQEIYKIEQLSHISTMSPFHFQRSFKAIYSVSPHKYLIRKKIDRAKFLLNDSKLSISEISQNIGFQSHSSFGRLFKRYTNMTPQLFRLQH